MAEIAPIDVTEASVAVFSPALLTSVTLEQNADGRDEIHIHPAGQGYWVARMLAVLGARPLLCCTIGGEPAAVAAGLVDKGVELRTVDIGASSGAYVDDRRSGQRQRLAEMRSPVLGRHELDDLVCLAVVAGIETGVVIVTGSNLHGSLPPHAFRSLTRNLHELGVQVIVDLSGDELGAALDGHVDVVKIAHDELVAAGLSTGDDEAELIAGAAELHRTSGADVFVTRADAGAIAHTAAGTLCATGPMLDVVDHRGAGDSFTAAVTLARVLGFGPIDQLRLAMAAAATNVLRHGLGSSTLDVVRAVAKQVKVATS